MAIAIKALGGLAILHRFASRDEIIKNYYQVTDTLKDSPISGAVGVSVGIKNHDKELASFLYDIGCKIFCIDVAHGDHDDVIAFTSSLRVRCPEALLIAGNVVTDTGARALWEAGADIIKIGVGPGSLCTTRIETGNGYPQLSALDIVCNAQYKSRDGNEPMFIADGGIKSAGDCVKALCFAELVMIGNLFAGTDEAPGNIITVSGQKFKQYAGSSTHKQKNIEGVVALVPYKGSVKDIVTKLLEGIRSGCSYQGASDLNNLKLDPRFVVISNAGLVESHPHNVRL